MFGRVPLDEGGGSAALTGSATVAQATTQTIVSVPVAESSQISFLINVDAVAAASNVERQSKTVTVTVARGSVGDAFITRFPSSVSAEGQSSLNWVWSVTPTATGFDLQVTTPAAIGDSVCAAWVLEQSNAELDPTVVAESPYTRFGSRILAVFDLAQPGLFLPTRPAASTDNGPCVGTAFDARHGSALSTDTRLNDYPYVSPIGQTAVWSPTAINNRPGMLTLNANAAIYWGRKISRAINSDYLLGFVLNVTVHGALCDFQNSTSVRWRVDSNSWYNGVGFSSTGGVLGTQCQTWELIGGTNGVGRYYTAGGVSGTITNNLAYTSRQVQAANAQSFIGGDYVGGSCMQGYYGYGILIHSPVAGDEAALATFLRRYSGIV